MSTERDGNVLIWNSSKHADTTRVRVPAHQLDQTVNCVTVHAARALMEDYKTGGATVVAHFCLYLQLEGGESSVALNSTGEDRDDGTTTLKFDYHEYPFSTSRSKLNVLMITVRREFTVYEAIAALLERNRDRYCLDFDSGSGCRHWCEVVLRDFEGYGWVDAEAAATVDQLTSLIKEEHPDVDVPTPAPHGQFY
ncbi:hypothetical protein CPB85DRAFT_1484228 [Mucidula mucida]|nr:hypothetical protein CPB85DRAFT_1484228 [Mucidula mucida]